VIVVTVIYGHVTMSRL